MSIIGKNFGNAKKHIVLILEHNRHGPNKQTHPLIASNCLAINLRQLTNSF